MIDFKKCNHYIKKLLIRALTKSPGVSTSGLCFYGNPERRYAHSGSLVAALADAADQHIHLHAHITAR